MNNISFKAKYECNINVKKKNSRCKFINKDAILLSLTKSLSDKKAIRDLSSQWESEYNYVPAIMADYFENNDENKKVYMLTEQADNFQKLAPEKILGIVELEKTNKTYKINYMQVRPDCQSSNKFRHFKNIGSTLLNFLTQFTGNSNIYLKSLPHLVEYYKKFGFEVLQAELSEPLMVLKKSKIQLNKIL